jgi:hypothetical protein
MSQEELVALRGILGDYSSYMQANPNSLLVSYCGHYHVRLDRGYGWEDFHFLVMTNLLRTPAGAGPILEMYDVKGSSVGRSATIGRDAAKAGKVGMARWSEATSSRAPRINGDSNAANLVTDPQRPGLIAAPAPVGLRQPENLVHGSIAAGRGLPEQQGGDGLQPSHRSLAIPAPGAAPVLR